MKHSQSKLNQAEQKQSASEQELQGQQVTREFNTAEELIRYDATKTELPPAITARLQESIGAQPPPAKPWWRRLFAR